MISAGNRLSNGNYLRYTPRFLLVAALALATSCVDDDTVDVIDNAYNEEACREGASFQQLDMGKRVEVEVGGGWFAVKNVDGQTIEYKSTFYDNSDERLRLPDGSIVWAGGRDHTAYISQTVDYQPFTGSPEVIYTNDGIEIGIEAKRLDNQAMEVKLVTDCPTG